MAEWTKTPANGAHWFQIEGCTPDIVWVHNGVVFDMYRKSTAVVGDVASGGMFYGPLDLPPPMPKKEACRCCCCRCK